MSNVFVTMQLTLLTASVSRCKYLFHKEIADTNNWRQFCTFLFKKVPVAGLPFLGELENMGIAYDAAWDDPPHNTRGTDYCRFDAQGNRQLITVTAETINPSIKMLMELINYPFALRDYVLTHHKLTTPWSWDNQIDYGGRYFARRLITPSDYVKPTQ